MQSLDSTSKSLQSQMLNKPLFVLYRRFTSREGMAEKLADHLRWMVELEKDGRLFAAGPFVDDQGKVAEGSLIILRAGSIEEAEKVACQDPLVLGEFVVNTLHEWRLMEGRMSVTVDFSDQSYRFD